MSAIIQLTQGQFAIVDQGDLVKVAGINWTALKKGKVWYARGSFEGRKVYMHRLLLEGVALVDHIDGNGLNNRKANLRPSCKQRNGLNHHGHRDNKSGYVGVSFDKSRNRYEAYISVDGTKVAIGRYSTAIEAALAYDRVQTEWAGEFGTYNFKEGV
jgi:hypothetical protein